MAAEEGTPDKPRKKLKIGRIFATLLVLALIGAGAYGASWLNARRYFLIVDATEVRVGKGRMLPVGHEPFQPADPALRKAYQPFPLPGGMKLPRGETVFDDRVQLDQSLYRMLRDAAEYSMAADNARTAELTTQYIEQLEALPGLTAQQQAKLKELERDATYVEARGYLQRGRENLKKAAQLFRESAKGASGRHRDGEARAAAVELALVRLNEVEAEVSAGAAKPASPAPKGDAKASPPSPREGDEAEAGGSKTGDPQQAPKKGKMPDSWPANDEAGTATASGAASP